MPTIARFNNCKIAVYPKDHPPAHFHLEAREWRVTIEIATLAVIAGDAANVRKATDAMTWAAENKSLLLTEWNRLNARKP